LSKKTSSHPVTAKVGILHSVRGGLSSQRRSIMALNTTLSGKVTGKIFDLENQEDFAKEF
jgi:hypothetical protein